MAEAVASSTPGRGSAPPPPSIKKNTPQLGGNQRPRLSRAQPLLEQKAPQQRGEHRVEKMQGGGGTDAHKVIGGVQHVGGGGPEQDPYPQYRPELFFGDGKGDVLCQHPHRPAPAPPAGSGKR